ncbi:MAG: prefoldin subunit [Nanoarchaeota archaeon]
MNKETQESINQIQLMEQSLQNLIAQKQLFQNQLLEAESATKELASSEKAYKIIGNLMILKDKKEIQEETKQKLERVSIRLKSIEKQEERAKGKIKELQDKVLTDMKK